MYRGCAVHPTRHQAVEIDPPGTGNFASSECATPAREVIRIPLADTVDNIPTSLTEPATRLIYVPHVRNVRYINDSRYGADWR